MNCFCPDYQDRRSNDEQLYYLAGTAQRLGCVFVDEPAAADFWLVQAADVPGEGAHSGYAKDMLVQMLDSDAPYGTTPAFVFTPSPSGFLWWYHNLFGPGDVVGLEARDDEDLSEAFHEFVGVLSDIRAKGGGSTS